MVILGQDLPLILKISSRSPGSVSWVGPESRAGSGPGEQGSCSIPECREGSWCPGAHTLLSSELESDEQGGEKEDKETSPVYHGEN